MLRERVKCRIVTCAEMFPLPCVCVKQQNNIGKFFFHVKDIVKCI